MAKSYEWEEALILNRSMHMRQMALGIPSKILMFIGAFSFGASFMLHWTTGIVFGVPMAIWLYRESYLDADGVILRVSNATFTKRLTTAGVEHKPTTFLEN